ncbi:hypothetical protein [Lysinibacillus xylanilyticus]|uniref:hypothetical protein n=1 Tax=Lysinibacillus xylanilyticus TaxID=582475 RepID=UPI003D03FBFA
MNKQSIFEESILDNLFDVEDEEMGTAQNQSSDLEELLAKALSPFYREYLINTYRDLISESIKTEASEALIDDYIYHSADAMNCSDEEIAEKLQESIAMKREEVNGDYLNESSLQQQCLYKIVILLRLIENEKV